MTENPFRGLDGTTVTQKEFRLQLHIIDKHAAYFPHVIITAFPGRPGDAKDGYMKKLMGVRAGVSDIILWWGYQYPNWALQWLAKMLGNCGFAFSRMHSGVVEIKVDARVSTGQNKFLSAIGSLQGNYGVVHSWREYYHLLLSFGIKPRVPCTLFEEPDYRSIDEKRADSFDYFAPR